MEANRLTIDRLNDYGCVNILVALIKSMGREYMHAKREYDKDHDDFTARSQFECIRNEFLSEYFTKLTGIVGADIVNQLDSGYNIGGTKKIHMRGIDIA